MTLEEFVKENIDLIDDPSQENLEQLYRISKQYGALGEKTYELTELLEDIGIDPLKTLLTVPQMYMRSSRVEEVYIPEGILAIEKSAYRDCRGLKKVDIAESVERIEDYAFDNCSELRYVIIRGQNTKIRASSFENCPWIRIHCSRFNEQIQGVAHVMGWPVFFID